MSRGASPARPYLSASRVKTWVECPERYRFQYVECVAAPVTPPLVIGSVVHEVIEMNLRRIVRNLKPLTGEALSEAVYAAWKFRVANEGGRIDWGDDDHPMSAEVAHLQMSRTLAQSHADLILPHLHPRDIETRFEVSLGDSFPFVLFGYYDLIETDDTIVDHKTYARPKARSEIDSDLQLTIYAFAFWLAHGREAPGLRLDCMYKDPGAPVRAEMVETSRTREDFERLVAVLEAMASSLQRGRYDATPGTACRWCPYKTACSAYGAYVGATITPRAAGATNGGKK